MEYSVVKIVSRGVSANWPMKAKFFDPFGRTSGRSSFCLGMKNAVTKGIMQGIVLQWFAARSWILSSGTPMWYSHSSQISSPVQSRMGFFT